MGNRELGKNRDFPFKFGYITYFLLANDISIARTNTKETSGYDVATADGRGILEIDWLYIFLKMEYIQYFVALHMVSDWRLDG